MSIGKNSSPVIGDPFAHQVGNRVRAAGRWGQKTRDPDHGLQEYLQEEAGLLPTRYEIEAFLSQVDILRDDVERVEARIERLTRQIEGSGNPS
jgi:ubiquinone biosynthesis accessory factor UbiJ